MSFVMMRRPMRPGSVLWTVKIKNGTYVSVFTYLLFAKQQHIFVQMPHVCVVYEVTCISDFTSLPYFSVYIYLRQKKTVNVVLQSLQRI